MADDRRELYTRDGVEAMKWGLVRAAIDRDIWVSARSTATNTCHEGSPDKGWRISFDHDPMVHDRDNEPGYQEPEGVTHHRLPAIPQKRGGTMDGTVYLEDHQGNLTPESADVWGDPTNSGKFEFQGLYSKWSTMVDDVFRGWDQVDNIPYEKDFWEAAGALRDAIKPLESMNVPGESYHTACRTLGLVTRDPGAQGTTPPERMWAPQINGPIDRFIIPLQGTMLNLFVLGEMLAAQLDGMGKMWQNARISVMDIGHHATKKMSNTPHYDADLIIKSAGWIVGAMGLIPTPVTVGIGLAATGLALAGADAIRAGIKEQDKDVLDLEAAIEVGPPDEILKATAATLNTNSPNGLEPQLEIDETDSTDLLRVAELQLANKTVYDPDSGTYETFFTINVDDVRADSAADHAPDVDIDVEFERLRTAGRILADELGEELRSIARNVQGICSTPDAWQRPIVGNTAIGVGPTGPWEDWTPVRDQMAQILDKTATQVVEVGEYLISTANFLERQDASAKAAMEKAATELDAVFK